MSETHALLEHEGEQLYVAHHRARAEPRGVVVLAQPIGLERAHAYITWVRWARALADVGFDAVRFDPRGMGESTGAFASMTWDAWARDLDRVVLHARTLSDAPLALCGARGGALLAARAFARGAGARVILWDAPRSARGLMVETLRRKLASDYAEGASDNVTRAVYVAALERGEIVEVEGYPWSRALWESARAFELEASPGDSRCMFARTERPHFWLESKVLHHDVHLLFRASVAFLSGGPS